MGNKLRNFSELLKIKIKKTTISEKRPRTCIDLLIAVAHIPIPLRITIVLYIVYDYNKISI